MVQNQDPCGIRRGFLLSMFEPPSAKAAPVPLGVSIRLLALRCIPLYPLQSSHSAGHRVELLKKNLSREA
jgi:hypothetical protein